MSENTDDTESGMTRREAMKSGGAVAGSSLLGESSLVGSASAQEDQEPRLQLGENYVIDDRGDDIVIEHLPSGAQFTYDSEVGEWTVGDLDAKSVSADRIASKSQLPDAILYRDGDTYFGVSKTDTTLAATTDVNSAWDSIMAALPKSGRLGIAEGIYEFNGAPRIDKQLTVEGASLTYDTLNMNLDGVVFRQNTAGEHGLLIQVDNADFTQVNLENIGIRFNSGLSSTGHGFAAIPIDDANGHKERGLVNPQWSNLCVRDHDGDHYAQFIVNSQHGKFSHLRGSGGGAIEMRNNTMVDDDPSMGIHCGNAVFIEPHHVMVEGGTAHGYHFNAVNQQMNIITMIHPSLRRNHSSAGKFMTFSENPDGADTKVKRIHMYGLNLEGSAAAAEAELPRYETGDTNSYVTVSIVDPDVDMTKLPVHGWGNWNQTTRASDTWHQNTTQQPLHINIELINSGTVGSDSMDCNFETAPPTTTVSSSGDGQQIAREITTQDTTTMSVHVPAGYHYRLNSFGTESATWRLLRA